jgi:endonuclease/exonuclease/phosphatase family metal-dependent hydrolase
MPRRVVHRHEELDEASAAPWGGGCCPSGYVALVYPHAAACNAARVHGVFSGRYGVRPAPVQRVDHRAAMGVLRLATWNLLHGRSLADGTVDVTALCRSVERLGADVLAVQEADRLQPRSGRADQTELIAAAVGAPWWRYAPALRGFPGGAWEPIACDGTAEPDPAWPSYGVGLVSRYPVAQWRVRRFAPPPLAMPLLVPGRRGLSWVPDEPRVALAAVVRGPRGTFTVAAAHLSTVPGWNARQLWCLARWLRDLPAPRFLLGDFNLPGVLPARVTGWRSLVRARTYPAWRPLVQFDHVLADEVGGDAVRYGAAYSSAVSDHRALRVDVDERALVTRMPASRRRGDAARNRLEGVLADR